MSKKYRQSRGAEHSGSWELSCIQKPFVLEHSRHLLVPRFSLLIQPAINLAVSSPLSANCNRL